jgi:hypothetical protein
MPTNIRINKRHWDQPYSLVRAHSGSQDENLGGNAGFNFSYKGSWAPEITLNEQLRQPFAEVYEAGNDAALNAMTNASISDNGLLYPNILSFQNTDVGEAYTYPYDGFGSIICEAAPNTAWEFSVKVKNMSFNGQFDSVDLYIFGLDESGGILTPSSEASGSEGGPSSIPTHAGYYRTQMTLPISSEEVQLKGIAQFDDNDDIRYLSMRIDVNGNMNYVLFYDLKLQPLNLKRSEQPLIWNSPRIFKPRENLTWGEGSTEETAIGNGTPHEYLRVSFAGPDDELVDRLADLGLRGWRYGPEYNGSTLSTYDGTGGTNIDFPSAFYNSAFSYNYWLLGSGTTPSGDTGPSNGIPPLPIYPEAPGRQHFGFKRSHEPHGEVYDHNYLYCEGSDSQAGKRFALRLPKINFNQTTREETLSFYFHSKGSQIGQLRIWHAMNGTSFYLPGDGSVHGTVTNSPGEGVAAQLTSIKYFDQNGSHINEYINSSDITGQQHSNQSDDWYRLEVDISELRGLNTHIIILYDQASDWLSDFAITNILVSGNNNP